MLILLPLYCAWIPHIVGRYLLLRQVTPSNGCKILYIFVENDFGRNTLALWKCA